MGGCYTGLDNVGQLQARRRSFDRVREPPYSLSHVTKCSANLEESVLVSPPTRECWFRCVTEMLLLCNEAAARFAKTQTVKRKEEADGIQTKPLGLEYMADRLDTDDPIMGYMVRTKREGWLQGFITFTTFTTWHKDFEWNSLVKEAGISDDDKRAYRWDYDNKLATALQAQQRDGDPNEEGIVWHRVAEVSLLGALGCGAQLMQMLIDELETGDKYDFLVLQATDNAVGFYEKMGFTRVGAISKPDEEAVAAQHAEAQRQREAKALERERQRQGKVVEKDVVKLDRERFILEAAKQQEGSWRSACRGVLRDLMDSPHASKVRWPEELPQGQVAKNFSQARAALDASSKPKDRKYKDTEEFVCDIVRLLRLAMAANEVGDQVHAACSCLLDIFKSAWKDLGENTEMAEDSSTRFYIYVDVMWESRQGFRLFELFGDIEDKGPSKAHVQAREWRAAKDSEYSGTFDAQQIRMIASKPKPQKLSWTARRDLHGVLQSETMCVKVAKISGGSALQEGDAQLLAIAQQAKTVALAYTRLHALRALQHGPQIRSAAGYAALSVVDASKQDCVDEPATAAPDVCGLEDDNEISEYERARLKRMEENKRLLEATGIMAMVSQVESLEDGHDSGARGSGSPSKRKRVRASGADDSEERVRDLRSKARPPPNQQQKKESELDKSTLSDTETPLKSEAAAMPDGAPVPLVETSESSYKSDVNSEQRAPGDAAKPEPAATTATQVPDASSGVPAAVAGGGQARPAAGVPMPAERPFPQDAIYVAKEDETPRMIAKVFGLDLPCLVKLNKMQYPTLTSNARLRNGTQLRLPKPGEVDVFIPDKKLDKRGEGWFAYCHWTYPDQQVEDIHPSYMMVRQLQRRTVEQLPDDSMLKQLAPRKAQIPPKIKSVQELKEEQEEEQKQLTFVLPEGWPANDEYVCAEDDRPVNIAKKLWLDADKLVGLNRVLYPTLHKTAPLKAGTKLRLPPPIAAGGEEHQRPDWWQPCLDIISKLKKQRHAHTFESPVDWEELGLVEYPFIITQPMDLGTIESKLMCDMYVSVAQVERDLRLVFDNAMHFNAPEDPVHQQALKMAKLLTSLWTQAKLSRAEAAAAGSAGPLARPRTGAKAKVPRLFNKVVEIEGGPPGYYFVLHYIPDMQWCHLAEMAQFGLFPKTYKNGKPHAFADRPQWKLVPEGQGAELDVSADRCRVVKCVTVNRVTDADKEAWDILEDQTAATSCRKDAKGLGNQALLASSPAKKKAGGCAQRSPAVASSHAAGAACEQGGQAHMDAAGALKWNAAIQKDALALLGKVTNNKKAWPFHEPVDPVEDGCPDYLEIIHTPCDLRTIGDRLSAQEYATAQAFLLDLLITFDNAQVYNPEGNKVHKLGADMSALVRTLGASSPYFGPALPAALEDLKRFKEEHKAGGSSGAGGGDESAASSHHAPLAARPQLKALQDALAEAVSAPPRTAVVKITNAMLDKISASLSGKLLKIGCNLSQADLQTVVQALKSNRSTERLDLDGCGVGDEGCEALCHLLVANKRIAHLDLQMNQLTDAGLKRLAEAVPHSGITELHVANNSVTEAGARALVDAAALQHKLIGRTMNISGISDSILAAARRRCPSEAPDITAPTPPGDGGVTTRQDKLDEGDARKEEAGAEAAGVSNGARDKASEAQAVETVPRTRRNGGGDPMPCDGVDSRLEKVVGGACAADAMEQDE